MLLAPAPGRSPAPGQESLAKAPEIADGQPAVPVAIRGRITPQVQRAEAREIAHAELAVPIAIRLAR